MKETYQSTFSVEIRKEQTRDTILSVHPGCFPLHSAPSEMWRFKKGQLSVKNLCKCSIRMGLLPMEDECSHLHTEQPRDQAQTECCLAGRDLCPGYCVLCMGGSGNLAKGQWHLGGGSDRFLQPSALSHKANGGVAMQPGERRMENHGITASQKGLI